MTEIDEMVAQYLDCKRRVEAAKDELEGLTARLMDMTKSVGGSHETPGGVKVKYTPATVNERFDWKGYLKDHPGASVGYMVTSPRKESLRVTEPKRAKTDEYRWEE